ncbi:ADP-ribosylglycohydrolase family protein [Sabulicella glaciei]|uniref:ADP-ribosylglycohydrolase family protein n=1 Tax=Sabulicella glaciei TaxID=2984948 RepID=A0ABT3NZT2_9PROT|nr:ADP-ribosylglycohydrolase family protein [Roseococcus sp. MDT2-1-1]MCW8087084.1 ADP-ribosylglycohydrolase family protein [Roseococcus sp. MDT2-1-1]
MSTHDDPARDRALGCFLGLAVGDALGTTVEFRARGTFAPVAEMTGGGPFRLEPGQWTDDTSMAICLAESLLAHPRLDERDLMERFCRWWREGENSATGTCFDIGNATRAALARFERSGNPFAGDPSPDAAGNGSIMRLAPVALRFWRDSGRAELVAERQSRVTHATPVTLAACILLCELLCDLIAGRADALAPRPRKGLPPRIRAIAAGKWRGQPEQSISSSGYVVHTLEAALWSLDGAADFEEAVLRAVNLGDDADTVGAVTGQLAGALWGLSGIPRRWLDQLHDAPRLLELAGALYDAGLEEG